jgi:hypothetical protein
LPNVETVRQVLFAADQRALIAQQVRFGQQSLEGRAIPNFHVANVDDAQADVAGVFLLAA